jgi:hypothetical protein
MVRTGAGSSACSLQHVAPMLTKCFGKLAGLLVDLLGQLTGRGHDHANRPLALGQLRLVHDVHLHQAKTNLQTCNLSSRMLSAQGAKSQRTSIGNTNAAVLPEPCNKTAAPNATKPQHPKCHSCHGHCCCMHVKHCAVARSCKHSRSSSNDGWCHHHQSMWLLP